MTGNVIRAFRHEHNQAEVAEQEYQLALDDYDRVIDRFSTATRGSVDKLLAARQRRNMAFHRFMQSMALK